MDAPHCTTPIKWCNSSPNLDMKCDDLSSYIIIYCCYCFADNTVYFFFHLFKIYTYVWLKVINCLFLYSFLVLYYLKKTRFFKIDWYVCQSLYLPINLWKAALCSVHRWKNYTDYSIGALLYISVPNVIFLEAPEFSGW